MTRVLVDMLLSRLLHADDITARRVIRTHLLLPKSGARLRHSVPPIMRSASASRRPGGQTCAVFPQPQANCGVRTALAGEKGVR